LMLRLLQMEDWWRVSYGLQNGQIWLSIWNCRVHSAE
jgi:hypothetical protein